MATELEIKAPALPTEQLEPDEVLATLAGRVELLRPATRTHLDASYHDDSAGRMRAAGWTLRARKEGDRIVATTKGPGQLVAGVRERVEINAPLNGLPEVGDPLPAAIAAALSPLSIDSWPPRAWRSVVQRTAAVLKLPTCTAELAIDHGHVEAGGRESPVRELELELVDGDPSGLLDAVLMLAAQLGLRPGGWAKAARGMALMGQLREPTLPADPTLMDRWEQLVDLEDRLRLGDERWWGARATAVHELVEIGAPEALSEGAAGFDVARVRIDTPEHATLLWGLFVAAVRQGAPDS
jgi:inorganic triphosphatase YgiF